MSRLRIRVKKTESKLISSKPLRFVIVKTKEEEAALTEAPYEMLVVLQAYKWNQTKNPKSST